MPNRSTSRSSSRPCFCGSGYTFKRCCGRCLTRHRTLHDPVIGALRVWRAHGPGEERFAVPEVMENVGSGQFAWMARHTSEGVSWMVDDEPLTLLELLNLVDPPVSDWVIDQTLALLWPQMRQIVALGSDGDGMPEPAVTERLATRLEADLEATELTVLMEEFTRFGQAANTLMERMTELTDTLESGGEGKSADGTDLASRRQAALRIVPPAVA